MRLPTSIDEARALAEYHERILNTTKSRERFERSSRLLRQVRPHLEALERGDIAVPVIVAPVPRMIPALPPPLTTRPVYVDDLEVVWSGGEGLSTYEGPSSLRALASLGIGTLDDTNT